MSLYEIAAQAYKYLPDDCGVESFNAWCCGIWKRRENVYSVTIPGDPAKLVGFCIAYLLPEDNTKLEVEWIVAAPSIHRRELLKAYIQAIRPVFGEQVSTLTYTRHNRRTQLNLNHLLHKLGLN